MLTSHTPLVQSPGIMQVAPFGHDGHEPPQSKLVSLPSSKPLVQVAATQTLSWQWPMDKPQSASTMQATHVPAPSQSLPPSSLQGVFCGACIVAHIPPLQTATIHAAAGTGQSVGVSQGMHEALTPSQAVPAPVVQVQQNVATMPMRAMAADTGRRFTLRQPFMSHGFASGIHCE